MIVIVALSLAVWTYLCVAHGGFWRSRPELPPDEPLHCPGVDIVVPARDEAQSIAPVVASLLAQDYRGEFRLILVDDNSSDGTADRAGLAPNLRVIHGSPKPAGWSGKLWALSQGVAAGNAPLVLLTDADIVHDPRHLSSLVAGLRERAMMSEMVRLNCASVAERALVPAFVYFFQMLYPFARVNDPRSRTAAAAGGTVLIRRDALERAGGIAAIKMALIDDVALASAVKARNTGGIYLGHSVLAASIRPVPAFRRHLAHDRAHGFYAVTLFGPNAARDRARAVVDMAGAGLGGCFWKALGTRARSPRVCARGGELLADSAALRP